MIHRVTIEVITNKRQSAAGSSLFSFDRGKRI